MAYDGLGRLIGATNAWNTADTNRATYAYDELGNQTNQMDGWGGHVVCMRPAGRRMLRRLPAAKLNGSPTTPWATCCGTPISTAGDHQRYDAMNRLVQEDASHRAVLATYAYSTSGMLTQRVDEAAPTLGSTNARDRCARTHASRTLYYQYDPNGNPHQPLVDHRLWGIGAYQYDALNRITNVVDNRLTGTRTPLTLSMALAICPRCAIQWRDQISGDNIRGIGLTNLLWKLNATTNASLAYAWVAAGTGPISASGQRDKPELRGGV